MTLPWYHDLKWSRDAINTMEELVNERSDRMWNCSSTWTCVPPASCAICTFDACDRRKAARREGDLGPAVGARQREAYRGRPAG